MSWITPCFPLEPQLDRTDQDRAFQTLGLSPEHQFPVVAHWAPRLAHQTRVLVPGSLPLPVGREQFQGFGDWRLLKSGIFLFFF